MIIKIDNERYINTDQIQVIEPHTSPIKSQIHFSRATVIVPNAIVAYIASLIDADTGYTEALTEADIPARSLPSRIASLLRNHLNGLTFSELITFLSLDKDTDSDNLGLALEALVKDNTIRAQKTNNTWRWFHNSTPGATSQW